MNEQQFGNKMEKDGIRIKNAVDLMAGDGLSHLKNELDEFTSTVKDNVTGASSFIRKDINYRMKQYNSKAQEIADKLHISFPRSFSKYPWVVISLGLVFGFMLGIVLKPSQQSR